MGAGVVVGGWVGGAGVLAGFGVVTLVVLVVWAEVLLGPGVVATTELLELLLLTLVACARGVVAVVVVVVVVVVAALEGGA